MEIVRIPEPEELDPEDQRFLEATKAWFKIAGSMRSPTGSVCPWSSSRLSGWRFSRRVMLEKSREAKTVFEEIAAFYEMDRPPAVFRWMARDVGFLQNYWAATREAFSDRKLDRLTKEVLAFAASLTAKSDYGVDFHLREARRLGLSEQGLTEAIEVVQCFNTVTKIADALQLEPDFDPRADG